MRRNVLRRFNIPTPDELNKAPFGSIFAEAMYVRKYHKESGWAAGELLPFGNLSLPPQSSCFHYGSECFEGLKAYRGGDGKVRLFRPDRNERRMAKSMERLGILPLPPNDFCEAIRSVVRRNERWVPTTVGHSLYLRPCAIGVSDTLRVGSPSQTLFFVIATPVGNYYPEGVRPVALHVETEHRRAWPGGTGAFKIGGNYAPTIQPMAKVASSGFAQCLWLGEGDVLQEVGAMNIMVVLKEGGKTTLATPRLDGTILEGVTRASILELAATYEGVTVSERDMTVQDIIRANSEGRLLEIFGCGTAAIVSPVKSFNFRGEPISVPVPDNGIAMRVRRDLLNIQHGNVPSAWTEIVS